MKDEKTSLDSLNRTITGLVAIDRALLKRIEELEAQMRIQVKINPNIIKFMENPKEAEK